MGQVQWISRGRIQVTLTREEQMEAARVAHERHISQRETGHDVSGLEVKATKRFNGSLILHESSRPELPAVLAVVDSSSVVNLVGWCFTKDGQLAKHWREDVPRPCFMVNQSYLRPMAELFKMLGLDVPKQEQEITSEELDQLLA